MNMRIRINEWTIIDAYEVNISPCGISDRKHPGKYKDMMCSFMIFYGDGGEYNRFEGEFKCDGATTFEECGSAANKFMDELYEKGYIDISTDEKCEEYGMIFW